jgi:hypothetical protein
MSFEKASTLLRLADFAAARHRGVTLRDIADAFDVRETDRKLRSTVLHPPHGRADLAGTCVNNVRRLDRLHDITEVAVSGLLPPAIGTYRA